VSYKGCFRPLGGDMRAWNNTPQKPVQRPKLVKLLYYNGLGPKCIYVHFSLDLLVKPLYNGIYDRE